jgi:hypothetical protein
MAKMPSFVCLNSGAFMFNLIGIIVVIIVLVIGFPSLKEWYSGVATPKETVDNIREKLGDSLAKDKNENNKTNSNVDDTDQQSEQKNSQSKKVDSSNSEKDMDNLQRMVNEVNKK